jgi:hypothetical protein
MQLMMQSAVRVVMKEAGKQLVSDLAAQMREHFHRNHQFY